MAAPTPADLDEGSLLNRFLTESDAADAVWTDAAPTREGSSLDSSEPRGGRLREPQWSPKPEGQRGGA